MMIVLRRSLLAVAVLLLVAPCILLGQNGQAPATILLIRHAEKLTDGQIDLSSTGFERAKLVPQLFAPSHTPALPIPQALFATHLSKHSNRPVQTIAPLSESLHLPIDNTMLNDDYAQLAQKLLSGAYAGKVVLVCWHHGNLPALATALGATPPYAPWPETQFDRVWRIDYKDSKATLMDVPQHLMPGDTN